MIREKDIPYIECICPKCKCKHKIQIKWVGGNVTPRIYCDVCKLDVSRSSSAVQTHSIINVDIKIDKL